MRSFVDSLLDLASLAVDGGARAVLRFENSARDDAENAATDSSPKLAKGRGVG